MTKWEAKYGDKTGLIRGVADENGVTVVRWNGIAKPATIWGQDNARLIVAAPELLAALKWARGCVPFPSDCHRAIVAAIEKAEGRG